MRIQLSENKNNNYFLNMDSYKYKVFRTYKTLDEAQLNQIGRAGWELCGIMHTEYENIYYLKKKES